MGKELQALYTKVQDHMSWDEVKTHRWFITRNPYLGDTTPLYLFYRRPHKLVKFVDSCIAENTLSESK